jgi:hypothetical protein
MELLAREHDSVEVIELFQVVEDPEYQLLWELNDEECHGVFTAIGCDVSRVHERQIESQLYGRLEICRAGRLYSCICACLT